MDIQKIIRAVGKYDYVSFDIFDTLIKRCVAQPSDVFDLTAIAHQNAEGVELPSFRQDRCEAEAKARRLSSSEDVTLDAIYDQLGGYGRETAAHLKRQECETELALCCLNRDFFPVYRYCLQQHKQIVLVSDMYHSAAFVRQILERCGIFGYRKLYVSSEYGLTKRSGHLYPFVLGKLGIHPRQLIHIGDSRRADFAMPRLHGIRAILITRDMGNLRYFDPSGLTGLDRLQYCHIAAFVNHHIPYDRSAEYKVGYETFGVLLYAFSKWLICSLEKRGIHKAFFLARDGQIMKKAFDLVNVDSTLRSGYLYASRRSILVPALSPDASLQDLLNFLSVRRVESVGGFLFRVGLEPVSYKARLEAHAMSLTSLLRDVEGMPEFAAFLREIKGDMSANSRRELCNLLGYLHEQNFDGHLALVDIGWRGAIQNALVKIAKASGLSVKISGYYMGMNREAAQYIDEGMDCEGFLFDSRSDYDTVLVTRAFQGLFETFFFAQHGSTIRYDEAERHFEPQLRPSEYSQTECRRIGEIQQGALDFIRDYMQLPLEGIKIGPRVAVKSLMKLGTAPTLKDLGLFGGISYYDTRVTPLAAPKSMLHYALHIRELGKDLSMSDWKVGFMKKLLKLPFPYLSFYVQLKKHDHYSLEGKMRNA